MTENISYIEDEEEMTRRSMPLPPAVFLAPPAFLESPADKEDRQRHQKLIDEARKKREDKFDTEISSQKISPRESRPITSSYRSQSSRISKGHSRTSLQLQPMS